MFDNHFYFILFGFFMLEIHSRWKIKVTDKVLMQWFADSWNEEAIIAYVKGFKEQGCIKDCYVY